MFAFSYLCIAFHLLVMTEVLRYYNSIYYAGHIGAALMYGAGVMLLNAKRAKQRREKAGEDKSK